MFINALQEQNMALILKINSVDLMSYIEKFKTLLKTSFNGLILQKMNIVVVLKLHFSIMRRLMRLVHCQMQGRKAHAGIVNSKALVFTQYFYSTGNCPALIRSGINKTYSSFKTNSNKCIQLDFYFYLILIVLQNIFIGIFF